LREPRPRSGRIDDGEAGDRHVIDAETARGDRGLVNQAVAHDRFVAAHNRLDEAVAELAGTAAAKSPAAVAISNRRQRGDPR
jgi:hypothetical protein